MFYNGANCDIYVGKGAGKKLLADIGNAKKSVKIVSPYLSPFLIKGLIAFNENNIKIELITTDDIEEVQGDHEKNILKLIIQNRSVDKDAFNKREIWKKNVETLFYCIAAISLVAGVIFYFKRDINLLLPILPAAIVLLGIIYLKNKIKNQKIYNYWYTQLFPFKVYNSPCANPESDTFIHSKIYIIDSEIAYLGSLNFTSSGTKYNYETRIRTEDIKAVKELEEEFNQLMYNAQIPEVNIQHWGSKLYLEPIN